MAARYMRDWTIEEFDEWEAAQKRVDKAKETSQEEGGPRVTLVPDAATVPDGYPTDMITVTASEDGGPRPARS